MALIHVRSKAYIAPMHVRSKVYIAPMHVRSKFADFALHMDESNADFAPHMEQSNADFAPHRERRHSFRDQKIGLVWQQNAWTFSNRCKLILRPSSQFWNVVKSSNG